MDDDYRKVAEVVYVQMRQMLDHSVKLQAEYGRWLVNSLLLLHGATIAGLLFKTSTGVPPAYLSSIWWFVGGIVLALATGFAAWWNFTFAIDAYNKMADTRLLTDREFWPKTDTNDHFRMSATLWIANATGIASVLCLIAGAFAVWCSWH